jgi:hypothetical protein
MNPLYKDPITGLFQSFNPAFSQDSASAEPFRGWPESSLATT